MAVILLSFYENKLFMCVGSDTQTIAHPSSWQMLTCLTGSSSWLRPPETSAPLPADGTQRKEEEESTTRCYVLNTDNEIDNNK